MSSNKLTTARYLLRQVQTKRLRLLSLANYHYLTSDQLTEIKMCQRAANELDAFIDEPEPVTLYALTGPPELPSIARGDTWAQSKVNPDHLKK